jgi:hypothetical protein
MAGILDMLDPSSSSYYGGILSLPDGTFPPADAPVDEAAAAQAAREAAAARLGKRGEARKDWGAKGNEVVPGVDATAPAIQYALGNAPVTPQPVNTTPLSPVEQKMMAMVGGGTPVPAPITVPAFGSLSPAPVADAQASVPPSAAAPAAVPLPRPRPVQAAAPIGAASPKAPADEAALPANAAPTQGQGGPPVPETSLLGRIGQGLKDTGDALGNHTSTLLALAGGLAGAPSWGTGLSRGLTAAASAVPVDQKLAMQQGGIRETYKALVGAGVSPQLALASVYNPDVLKSTVDAYLADRKGEVKTIKDASGNERLVLVNPYNVNQPVRDLTPQGAGASGILAPGVAQEDKTLSGDAYLAQYSPELQAMAKAYANGDIMPTGNPRMQGLQPKAKEIAIKWGVDTGTPVSDATYAEKRHIKSDLGASGNSSLGGILSNGQSSFSHLAELGESMSKLGNVSHDFPGGGPAAAVQNYVGNAIIPSSAIKAKIKAINDNLGHYGQESTKFYAGTGGGEAERMNALKEMNPQSTSSEEMAAYLEKEKSLMLDRMNTKFAQIKQGLGEQEGNIEIQKKLPDLEKNIARIDASIARLRGEAPPPEVATQPQAAPAGAPKPGNYVWVPGEGLMPQ